MVPSLHVLVREGNSIYTDGMRAAHTIAQRASAIHIYGDARYAHPREEGAARPTPLSARRTGAHNTYMCCALCSLAILLGEGP